VLVGFAHRAVLSAGLRAPLEPCERNEAAQQGLAARTVTPDGACATVRHAVAMDRPARIAVVGPVDDRLVGDLRALPLHPEVRAWRSLCTDSEAVTHFEPQILLAGFGPEAAEELGALRFLQNLRPDLRTILVAEEPHEVQAEALARRLGAGLVVHPGRPGQLAAAIEQAHHRVDRPRADAFVDLARGIADEVNNPLMQVSGHLQLLRGVLDKATERDRSDLVDGAVHGIERIHAAVERLRLIATAANGPQRREQVDLGQLISDAVSQRNGSVAESHSGPQSGAQSDRAAAVAIGNGSHLVTGDREQLAAAVAALVRFADDLANGDHSSVRLDALQGAQRLRLTVGARGLAAWQLPRSFEPHYPMRALRGQTWGLALFLAQTVALGHGGQATARRLPDGSLQFDFVWQGGEASSGTETG
jgi:nitrogen-specific signal transduction histidine kinase